MERRISILGSTGSIGDSTLSLLDHEASNPSLPDVRYKIVCLSAGSNAKKLAQQALQYRPEFIALADPKGEDLLREALTGTNIKIGIGPEASIEAGAWPTDFTMAAIVGAAGLAPTLAAVKQGNRIGLANKECLVCAGQVFMAAVQQSGAELLPVDSEHNAIFQVLNQKRPEDVKKLILTASGGPFHEFEMEALREITREQALAHPVWDMGAKISIDSATMMNKGLELIEASFLFDRPEHEIDILVHPQSIIHSMVEYIDGSVLAQMGSPDMRTPIANVLAYPHRMKSPVKSLDLAALGQLSFFAPDAEKFISLRLARDALKIGGAAPTVLNAANEIAVAAFLARKIAFLSIPICIERVLNKFVGDAMFSRQGECLESVVEFDQKSRTCAREIISELEIC